MKYVMLSNVVMYLKQKHTEYNKKFFKNKLQDLPFNESKDKKFIGEYIHKGPESLEFRFGKILSLNKDFADIVLLHEMCHQAQIEISHDIEPENNGHDRIWKTWMKMVGLNPPERYETADGFYGLDIKNMTLDEILDAINNNKQEKLDSKKELKIKQIKEAKAKQEKKEKIITKKRIELNKQYAMQIVLKLMKPIVNLLIKKTKKSKQEIEKQQLILMKQDFNKYLKMAKKVKIKIPEKIELGLKKKWNLILFNKVEKLLGTRKSQF